MITLPGYEAAIHLVAVYTITEWKKGTVYKTKFKGFALKTRPKQPDEIYSSLSTNLTKQENVTVDLIP